MFKIYSQGQADKAKFWKSHWDTQDISARMEAAKRNELISIFKKSLPVTGKVLEAGCGQGIFVNALNDLGYEMEGVDFDGKTVELVNAQFPTLKIKKGDVFQLEYPDNYFDGYISLGVIEHYENKWQEPLQEAYRVLTDGGIIFVSVPYYNWIRRIYLPIFGSRKSDSNFYQYLFTKKEILKAVKNSNFRIKSVEFYGKTKTLISLPIIGGTLRRKHSSLRKSESASQTGHKKSSQLLKMFLKFLPGSLFAHMIMVIGEKQ